MSQEALNTEHLNFYPAGNVTADIFIRFFSFSIYSTGLAVLTLASRFQ